MKILIVRFKQIGDALLSSVVCNSLKKSFPDSEIDYLVYEHIAPVFKNHPYIDNVISITKKEQKNPFLYLKKVYSVTRKKYDVIIDLMATPKSEFFCLFSLGTKYRIGRVKDKRTFLRGATYNSYVPHNKNQLNESMQALEALKHLENKGFDIIYDSKMVIALEPQEKETIKMEMTKAGVDFNKKIFVFSINSRRPEKVYPVDKMKKLIEMVLEKYDAQIIFYYSQDEKEFAKNMHKNLNNDKRIFSNIKTETIRELGALISNCDIFVGNEGGPRHLAECLGIPTLSIWRPGCSDDIWCPGKGELHQTINIEEYIDKTPNFNELEFWEKFNLMQPEDIFNKLEKMIPLN